MTQRSLTIFQDGKTEIAVLYRQSNGFPSGHGRELAEFLAGFVLTDGFGKARPGLANGMYCLSAWVVARFKRETGEFYLEPAGARNVGEEFRYTVYTRPGDNRPHIRAEAVYSYGLLTERVDVLFDGTARDFIAWLDAAEAETAA